MPVDMSKKGAAAHTKRGNHGYPQPHKERGRNRALREKIEEMKRKARHTEKIG